MRKTPIWVGLVLPGLFLIASLYNFSPNVNSAPANTGQAQVLVNWNQVTGQGPAFYGVEYVWVDQDRELFLDRYRALAPRVLRVQISQEAFEPVNDNNDPLFSEIRFNQTFVLDAAWGKTVNFEDMFTTLAAEFPQMQFHLNIWLAARWNAAKPDGYLGLGGAFPPISMPEHQEFIRALASWLVSTCGIKPERISFSFINEPNLTSFYTGTISGLVDMADATRAALDQVSPSIKLSGLDEVHGVSWTDQFYAKSPGSCCEFWTFHAYEKGFEKLGGVLVQRSQRLSAYGPVWVTEFADTQFGSPDAKLNFSSRLAAISFARLGALLWKADVEGVIHFRLADTYLSVWDTWAGHGLFADWRGSKSGGVGYAIYPAFWVFANLFQRLGDGQILQTSFSGGLEGTAVRPAGRDDALAVWIVNPGTTPVSTMIQAQNFPASKVRVDIIPALQGLEPVEQRFLQGEGIQFELTLAAESAVVVWMEASRSTITPTIPPPISPPISMFLPFVLWETP
jgi:hypothetical protein